MIQRVGERVRLGGHDVPESTIRRRYLKGLRNFFKLYQPLADTWAVYDNSVSGNPIIIATGKEDVDITVSEVSLWEKICEAVK